MSELESLASTALKKAESGGASQAEAFVLKSRIRSVYVENSVPRVADDKSEAGLGLKICFNKRIGFSSGTVNEKSIEEIVKEALRIARATKEDPYFESLPAGRKISGQLQDVFCKETVETSLEDVFVKVMSIVKTAEEYHKVKVPLGLIRLADYSMYVTNSLGVQFHHQGTMVFLHFTAKATAEGKAGEGIEKKWSTSISKIDFEEVGSSIAEKALATLKAEPFREKLNLTAIIDPVELNGLLSAVEFATNSEQVNKGRSPWIEKLGVKVAGEKFTLLDDGRYPGGIRSALADDEGVETGKKTIIDKGVLKSYIYDSYNAYIADTKSTGNAYRRGTRSIEGAFTSPANCAYSTMIVKPGNKNLDDIISQIDKGVLIETFASPEVNPITGGFGCEVRNATVIEKGQLTRHVKHALLIGNMYEALQNIFDIGKNAETVENAALPPIAFSEVTLVGQK